MPWKIPKMWEGGSCWIIGGGASIPYQFNVPENIINDVCSGVSPISIYSSYMSYLHDKHVIGVNDAYLLGSWLDFCFFGDSSWYLVHKRQLVNWPGIKVSCASRFANAKKERDINKIKFVPRTKIKGKRVGITAEGGTVSWNHNSGAASISLAVQLGAKKIYLLGFDMDLYNDKTHWHGGHVKNKKRVKKVPFTRHLRGFPEIRKDAIELGVEIVNVSPDSRIKGFKKSTIQEIKDADLN